MSRNKPTFTLRSILYSKAFTAFAIVNIILLSVSLVKEIIRQIEVNKQIKELEQQVSTLEQNNQQLTQVMHYFNSSSFQEKEVREKLGLKKTGEQVVMIPNNSVPNTGTINVAKEPPAPPLPNIIKWKHYFFN